MYFEYVVVIMRKIRITIITSMSGTRLISSGSFSPAALEVHRSLAAAEVDALAVDDVDQLRGLLLHLHDEGVDLVAGSGGRR